MDSARPLFSTKTLIALKWIGPTGTKTVTVQFPTDEQVSRRQRARKMFSKGLGRGATEFEVIPNEEADLQILSEIRQSDPDQEPEEIDGAEATDILDRLSEAEVQDVVRDGPAFRVLLKVPGALTEHLLSIPTVRQRMTHQRQGTRVIQLPFGKREIRINLQAAGELYDQLVQEKVGYAPDSAIPLGHKATAVQAALTALEQETAAEGNDDPDSFR